MNLIKELNGFDTPEISDALDACHIEGALLGIKPIIKGAKIVGPIFTVKYLPYENKPANFKNAGNYIDDVPANSIILIDNDGREDCTTWGSILTQAAKLKNISGVVIHGSARDINFIEKESYPVFASAIYMRSGKNRVFKYADQCELNINNITIRPFDIIIADDHGVLIIPQDRLVEVIRKAHNIRKTENCIVSAVKNGMSLKNARERYRYDQPWIHHSEKI